MTIVSEHTPAEANIGQAIRTKIAREKTSRFDRINEWLSDWCSAILVKETRQALKSRHFLWTYFLLLTAAALWIVGYIAVNHPFDSAEKGKDLIHGMFVIITVPLGVIIPFGAYRSLAKEYEDGTIQLISVTTLKPYQIIWGKFGSAMLQMMIYLAVMAPCILMGYFLPGISLSDLMTGLIITVLGSVFLTTLGLLLGGITRSRALTNIVSVLFILGLGWLAFMWSIGLEEILRHGLFRGAPDEAYPVLLLVFTGIFSFALLFIVTSSSLVSFESDNHSTPSRLVMLFQQSLFLGMVFVVTRLDGGNVRPELGGACMVFAVHYWLLMGYFSVGESPVLSRRVQRSLPESFLGRSFGALLMPGPGRGFLFCLANLWGCGLVIFLLVVFGNLFPFAKFTGPGTVPGFGGPLSPNAIYQLGVFIFMVGFYPTLFLAVNFLLIHWRTRRMISSYHGLPVLSLILGIATFLIITVSSLLVQSRMGTVGIQDADSLSAFFNFYLMISENFPTRSKTDFEVWFMMFVIPASLLIGFAVLKAARELLKHQIAVPQRVIEDSTPKKIELPAGESLDEIFGNLKDRRSE